MQNCITPKHCSFFACAGLVLALTGAGTQLPSQQRQKPPAGPQPLRNGTMLQAPAPVQTHPPGKGTVIGYIYWDTGRTSHSPANACSGLSIALSASYTKGTFTPLSGQPQLLGWIGQVANFGVCGYKISSLPTDTELRVQVSVNPATSFAPAVVPPTALQVRAHNSQCTHIQGLVPTVSELQGKWTSCNNTASNVNFALAPSSQLLGGASHGVLLHPTPAPVGPAPLSGGSKSPSLLLRPGEVSPGPALGGSASRTSTTPGGLKPGALPFSGAPRIIKGTKSKVAQAANQQLIIIAGQLQATNLAGEHTTASSTGTVASRLAAQPNTAIRMNTAYTPSNLLTAGQNTDCAQRTAQNGAPVIYSVSGKDHGSGIIYTPDPSGNPYLIIGCKFGAGGTATLGVNLDPNGAPAHTLNLHILSWSNFAIRASIDPATTHMFDWPFARLLVTVQQNGAHAITSNGTFYAARATVAVPSLPKSESLLYNQGSPYYLSPVSNYYGMNGTVAVMRQGLQANAIAGQDNYTLKLAPGFVIDSTETDLLVSSVDSNVTAKPAQVNGNTISVTYPVLSSGMGTSANYYSLYGLTIWVTGPKGIDPITGNPN